MVGCYELQIQLSVLKSEQYEPETVIRLRNGNGSVRKYSLVKKNIPKECFLSRIFVKEYFIPTITF